MKIIFEGSKLEKMDLEKIPETNNISSDMPFNKEKFKEVFLYIISQCGFKPNVGKTVLFKLLYFTDFDFYELYEKSITGELYKKLPLGPAPNHFDEVIEELKEEKKITKLDTTYKGFEQQKYLPMEEPEINLISGKELKVINDVIAKYSHMTAKQISAHSHEDIPYKATKEGSIINYEFVFYREPLFSVREYKDD